MVLCEVRQVQRQAGTDHDRVDSTLQSELHRGPVFGNGAHHVDGEQPTPVRAFTRGADFALQGFEIGRVDALLGRLADVHTARALECFLIKA